MLCAGVQHVPILCERPRTRYMTAHPRWFGMDAAYGVIGAMLDTHKPAALRRAALVGRYATAGVAEPLQRLAGFLAGRGIDVVLEAETAAMTPLPGYPTAEHAD